MRLSITLQVLAIALSNAAPLEQRTDITDAGILNYALTLEHLEDKFYRDGLANFSASDFASAGFGGAFYTNLMEVSYDEMTHVSFLTSALQAAGATPVAECTYNFGVTDVASFVATASILEGVGVSAYLGAAASISNKAYLTAAASILTVESRHSSYLRAALMQSPFPQPFDAPLDFNQVFALASGFIVSCPSSNPAFLPLMAFPSLIASGNMPYKTGDTITLTVNAHGQKWGAPDMVCAAWAAVTGYVYVEAHAVGDGMYQTMIPAGFHGQSYVVLTSSCSDASDGNIVAGPAIVEISGSNGAP